MRYPYERLVNYKYLVYNEDISVQNYRGKATEQSLKQSGN